MDVYYFRADLTPHLAPLIEELCLTEGLPYTVDLENHCDPVINDFFISLVGPRTRCTRTWGTYAQQLSFFFRFLDSRAISWRGVTQDDLLHYYRIRRVVDGSLKVSAPSWKVFVAAIRCFYEWALRKGYVSVVPFEYKEVRSGANYATPRRALTAINITERARKRDLKYLTEEEFRERLLPAVTGTKQGIRNALFVRLLMRSGLRADEAVTLTLSMLPDPDDPRYAGRKTCPMRVTGKGQKERTVRVPKSWLRDVQRYVEWDRADAVESWANKYPKQTPLSGGHRDRLFLTSQGTPISYSAVYDMMRKCGAKAGFNFNAHPHMLRHSYAIYQLSAMIKALLSQEESLTSSTAIAYGRMIQDPLKKLQDLLGHSSITTTFIYLDYVDDMDDIADVTSDEEGFDPEDGYEALEGANV